MRDHLFYILYSVDTLLITVKYACATSLDGSSECGYTNATSDTCFPSSFGWCVI